MFNIDDTQITIDEINDIIFWFMFTEASERMVFCSVDLVICTDREARICMFICIYHLHIRI